MVFMIALLNVEGRWKSEAHIRYVAVDAVRAGTEISNALIF